MQVKVIVAEEQAAAMLAAVWLTAADMSEAPVYSSVATGMVAYGRNAVTNISFPF